MASAQLTAGVVATTIARRWAANHHGRNATYLEAERLGRDWVRIYLDPPSRPHPLTEALTPLATALCQLRLATGRDAYVSEHMFNTPLPAAFAVTWIIEQAEAGNWFPARRAHRHRRHHRHGPTTRPGLQPLRRLAALATIRRYADHQIRQTLAELPPELHRDRRPVAQALGVSLTGLDRLTTPAQPGRAGNGHRPDRRPA